MDTSDESSSTHLPWSQPFISFTGSSSSSFDLTPGGNNNGNNNDNVISSRTNNHSNNLYNNDHCTQWLPSSKQSQQLDPRITNNVLLQYNNNENNNDDENSNGNIDLSRKRNHDSLINDERYLDSVEFDSSLYDDVVIDPSIFDTVHQYNQLPSQSSIESKGDSPNYIGGSVMLVISQQCSEDTASLFRHAINIFVPDKTSHTAKCVVAFFEDNPLYSILQVSCSSMEEWRSNNADHNAETTHLSHLQKRFKNIIEKGSEVLTRLENEDNDEESQSSQEETSLSFLTTISNDLKIQDAASKRVEINGQLSPEQIVTACELLDELYLKAVEAVMSEHTIGLPYINNAKMVGVIEKVDIFIYSRILHLNYTLRKRLGERLDNNTTQELKYCLEEVYEGYSDKYGCLNRDLERLCKHLNITPCALGATTTPLRRAYGAFAEVTKDEDVIDWNVSQNADGGLGRLVTTRYRNHLDDIENDIVALRPTNGDIKCILYTEDLGELNVDQTFMLMYTNSFNLFSLLNHSFTSYLQSISPLLREASDDSLPHKGIF